MAKRVEVDIKTRGADKASKNLRKVDKGLGRLAKSAAGAAGAFFGARMLLDGFRNVVNATREQILAETQLNAVLKSTAGAAGLNAKELTGMASALQKQTRFGDEAIIKAQSLLLTFTKVGKEVFPDAIESILNMSEAMGQDLQQGVIQVGKALNDPILGVTALRRVGVQLSDQQVDLVKKFTETGEIAKAQKIILGELETQFGGVAKAAGDTMPGALDQMNNAVGDAQEALGTVFSSIIITLAEDVTDLANSFEDGSSKLTPFVEVLNTKIEKDGFLGTIFGGIPGVGVNTLVDLGQHLVDEREKQDAEIAANNLRKNQEIIDNYINANSLIFNAALEHNLAMAELDDNAFAVRELGLEQDFFIQDAKTKNEEANINKLRKIDKDAHKERMQNNLQSAILQGQSAKQAGIAVIKSEISKSTAALITKIMQTLPFPVNLAVAAGAGAMVGGVTDKLLNFQTGGSFVTKGRTTLPIGNGVVVGDNASGMERVDVTPLPAPPGGNNGNITINISAPLVDETVVDTIIPAIRRAEQLNL